MGERFSNNDIVICKEGRLDGPEYGYVILISLALAVAHPIIGVLESKLS